MSIVLKCMGSAREYMLNIVFLSESIKSTQKHEVNLHIGRVTCIALNCGGASRAWL